MTEGLDPTLGALLPLLGVALGALLGGLASYALKRRDERTEARAVARILLRELNLAELILRTALDEKNYRSLDQIPLRSATWEAHRVMMARHVDDETWDHAAGAYFDPWGLERLHSRKYHDVRERGAEVMYGHVVLARAGLEPYARRPRKQ